MRREYKPRAARIFWAYFVDGVSISEIAKEHGISMSNAYAIARHVEETICLIADRTFAAATWSGDSDEYKEHYSVWQQHYSKCMTAGDFMEARYPRSQSPKRLGKVAP